MSFCRITCLSNQLQLEKGLETEHLLTVLRLASTLFFISFSAVDKCSSKLSNVTFTVAAPRKPQSDKKYAIAVGCIIDKGFSEGREVFRGILVKELGKIVEINRKEFAKAIEFRSTLRLAKRSANEFR